MEIKNKVALITGGANGIGAATALKLATGGADIAIVDLETGESADKMKSDIEAIGRKCIIIPADLSKTQDAEECVTQAAKALGSVDILIHCAGGAVAGSLLEVSPQAWHKAFDIHVHAVFYLCRAAVPLMKQVGCGSIVLISSGAGLRGCSGAIAYCVTKGAIPQFTRALAREFADDNIRVNCVAPGIIRTRFQDYLTAEQVKNNIENRIPLHREGKPEDVAEAINMLVTNDFITGENIAIDGGMTMRMA